MKTKKLIDYLRTRLTEEEIIEIDDQAHREVEALRALQADIINAMDSYMKRENVGFNEFVKRLDVSPAHIAKLKKGEANLTLSSIARIYALIGQTPHIVTSKK